VLLKDEDQALAAHTKGGKKRSHFQKETHLHKEYHSPNRFTHSHKESYPLRRFQKFQKGKRREKVSPLINVIIVISWDTLLRIVLPEGKNKIREIKKEIMPMKLKMMSHLQR